MPASAFAQVLERLRLCSVSFLLAACWSHGLRVRLVRPGPLFPPLARVKMRRTGLFSSAGVSMSTEQRGGGREGEGKGPTGDMAHPAATTPARPPVMHEAEQYHEVAQGSCTGDVKEEPQGESRKRRRKGGSASSETETWRTIPVPRLGYGGFSSAIAVIGCSGCSYAHWHVKSGSPRNFYQFSGTAHEFDYYAREWVLQCSACMTFRPSWLMILRRWSPCVIGHASPCSYGS